MLFDLNVKLFSISGSPVIDIATNEETTAGQVLASIIANYQNPTPNAGWLHKKALRLFQAGELETDRADLQVVIDLVNQVPGLALSVRAQILGLLDPARFDK